MANGVLKGFGTIISFDLEGDAEFADRVCQIEDTDDLCADLDAAISTAAL